MAPVRLVKSSPPAYWMKELSSLSHTLFSRQSISERRSLCVSCLIITGGKNISPFQKSNDLQDVISTDQDGPKMEDDC